MGSETASPVRNTDLLPDILKNWYAWYPLDSEQTDTLSEVREEADRFSSLPLEKKRKFEAARRNIGWRPPEHANAGDETKPDTNDSYLYWGPHTLDNIPGAEHIQPLLRVLENYRQKVVVKVVAGLVQEFVRRYDYPHELPFDRASIVQINSFCYPTDRELLQTRHEDGTMATVLWTSAKGLEIETSAGYKPITCPQDQVLVFGGDILRLLTGGDLQPLFHRARNHGDLTRKSITCFSNPDVHRGPIVPFITNDINRGIDIRRVILEAAEMFGLEWRAELIDKHADRV